MVLNVDGGGVALGEQLAGRAEHGRHHSAVIVKDGPVRGIGEPDAFLSHAEDVLTLISHPLQALDHQQAGHHQAHVGLAVHGRVHHQLAAHRFLDLIDLTVGIVHVVADCVDVGSGHQRRHCQIKAVSTCAQHLVDLAVDRVGHRIAVASKKLMTMRGTSS